MRRTRRRGGIGRAGLKVAGLTIAFGLIVAQVGLVTAVADGVKVTICHRTNSATNPYVVEAPDRTGVDGSGQNDHFRHTGPIFDPTIHRSGGDWGDIIPPFDDNGDPLPPPVGPNGLNWTPTGQSIWAAGCTLDYEIQVTKSVSPTGPIAVGGTVTFTLDVKNTGSITLPKVVLTDTLPAGLVPQSATPGGACGISGQKVTCQLGTLAAGVTTSVTITAKDNSNGATCSYSNTGTAVSTNLDGDVVADDTSNAVTVNVDCPDPDVKVVKSSSAAAVNAGDSFSFTLTASNVGHGTAKDVVIKDTIPAGLTINTAPGCTISGQNVTCNVGDIAETASKSVTINVTTTPAACPSVTNTGTVSASNEKAGSTGNNTSNPVTVDVRCPDPDVKVTKGASSAQVVSGGQVTFTLTASNVGQGTAANVIITDTFPAGLTINTAPGCSITGQLVTCNVGDIAAGASKNVSVTATATDGACPSVTNTALVSASNESTANKGNNASNPVTVGVTCPDPDVVIRKADDAPVGGVEPGDEFTYTIRVENAGGADATNVEVSDTIPDGLDIVSASGNCSTAGQDVTCDLGTVAAGDTETVTITVRVQEGACPEVVNNATVTAGNEPAGNTGNNTSNDVVTLVNCIEPGVSVRISKTNDANGDGDFSDNEEAKKQGLDVPFLLVITNTGTVDVKITDLTDSFDQTTLDLLDQKCGQLKGKVLGSGQSVTCEFTMRNYSPPEGSPLDNVAEICVQADGGQNTDCDDDTSRVRSAEVLGRTITKTPPGGTAFTGDDGSLGKGLVALMLLLGGSWLLWAGYRRRASYEG